MSDRHALAAGVWAALVLFACGDDDRRAVPAAAPTADPPPAVSQPTFTKDIAPIVWRHCAPCHRPGEAAPFPLLTYEDVRRKRRQIAKVLRLGIMPPWLPRADHLPLVGDRRLREAMIATIQTWVDVDAPRGDAADLPPRPAFPDGWQLRQPDLVLTPEVAFELPADGPDLFRNFVVPVPPQIDAVRYVEAFELRAGSAAVHHAILRLDRSGSARRADAADPGPGFGGMTMAAAEPPDGHFLGWTLGKQPRPLPAGLAWRLHPGSDLVLQLHLTPTGKAERIQPRIGLLWTDRPPTHRPFALTLFSEQIDIPAGAVDYVVADLFELPVEVEVIGLYPHAHYLCRRMRGFARLPDGGEQTLIEIDRWDFDWQDDYLLVDPLRLPKGTRVGFEYVYDNSSANPGNPSDPPRRVKFGPQSTDEMGTLTLTVVPTDARGHLALREATWRHTIRKKDWDWDAYLGLGRVLRERRDHVGALEQLREALRRRPEYPDALAEAGACLVDLHRPDTAERMLRQALALAPEHAGGHLHLGRLHLQRGDQAAGERALRAALRAAPDWVDAHSELGNLLARRGAVDEAIRHFERVIALRPQIPEAHNNLATALFAHGQLDAAIKAYRRALALRPGYFNARFNLGRVLIADGRSAAGRVELEQAARLRPDDPAVRAALRSIR